MRARGIHHLGVAVHDLDEAVATYTGLLGGELEHRDRVEDQGVEAAAVMMGAGRIELLAALGGDTPVGRFLEHRGQGMHHVAYEVADVRAALDELAAAGAQLIDEEPGRGCSASRSRSSIQTPCMVSSRRWFPLAESEAESVRVELAFDGGQILSALVTAEGADQLEARSLAGGEGTFALDASDGRYTSSSRASSI